MIVNIYTESVLRIPKNFLHVPFIRDPAKN